MPRIAPQRRVIAPDMLGFGYTERPQPPDQTGAYTMDAWVQQAVDLLDQLDIAQADLVGNSFGGALSLALACRHPQRVRRLVLMGSVGVGFPITPGLDAVWGYTPSFENIASHHGRVCARPPPGQRRAGQAALRGQHPAGFPGVVRGDVPGPRASARSMPSRAPRPRSARCPTRRW